MLTWFVIGPVSSTLRTWNGGLAENAIASPRTVTHTSLPSGVKNASRGERPTYVTCFTALVAVSMKLTELEPIETTTSVRWSGEKPRPWTRSWPRSRALTGISGAVAACGTWPPSEAPATSATAKRVERRRATSVLPGVIGRGLRRRRTSGRKGIAEREMHHRDLLLLVDDDLLGKPLQALVPSVAQLGDRHVDGTLVVRDHHACEVAVRTAREGHVHGRMHAGSRALDHRLEPGAPGRGLAVRGSVREGESENRGEREGRRLPENRLESGGHVQLQSDHPATTATNVNTATDQLFAKIVRRRSCEPKGVRVQSGGKAMPEPVATVFVVDDDASIREALASLVRSAGLKAETFATAQEFLARAPADAPSCLVLDVRMPGLSGLDLQSRMRELNLEIPVVFITG